MVTNNCLARWHIQWPISSCSVIFNGSVLKWQTCDFMSDCCVLCRDLCSVHLKSAILNCKMCVKQKQMCLQFWRLVWQTDTQVRSVPAASGSCCSSSPGFSSSCFLTARLVGVGCSSWGFFLLTCPLPAGRKRGAVVVSCVFVEVLSLFVYVLCLWRFLCLAVMMLVLTS